MSHESSTTNDTLPSRDDFRHAMSRLGAAVNVITTAGPAGTAGFTATAVCSVSDTPPTLLVCMNRNASVYATFKANRRLCVNILGSGHEDIAKMFGGNVRIPMESRFGSPSWIRRTDGVPVLRDAVARIDCAVTDTVGVGTHDVLFCTALEIEVDPAAEGLIYFDRRFVGVPTLAAG